MPLTKLRLLGKTCFYQNKYLGKEKQESGNAPTQLELF